ncbi:hypothetical protein HZC31_08595 [Candidatus Woesearchaeota archaeon]|nr:hypothetical protein [Candidatus Woesearchaeota archaeon]
MTNSRETRTYVIEGRHNREDTMAVDSHVIIFARSGLRLEGLEHVADLHKTFPVTVVKTGCPNAHSALEERGYRRAERYSGQTTIPSHEHDF